MKETFEDLRSEVVAAGLFERTYLYYALYGTLLISATAFSLFLITATQNPIVQFFNAILLGCCFVQAGMLGHDLSHGQVFASWKRNRFFSTIVWGILAAASESRWYAWHSAHHLYTNQVNRDPDLNIPFLFSEKQLHDRSPFLKKYVLPYQHILFFFSLPMVYLGIHRDSVTYIFLHPERKTMGELVMIVAHFALLLFLLFTFLPWYTASMFFVVHALAGGLYMGVSFAPNHKGEEVVGEDENVTWLNQITSTRDLYPGWFTFHFFGGLGFQVEHHLFPDMPRMHYWKANKIVKAFCARNGIPFHETSFFGSMREIYRALKEESARA